MIVEEHDQDSVYLEDEDDQFDQRPRKPGGSALRYKSYRRPDVIDEIPSASQVRARASRRAQPPNSQPGRQVALSAKNTDDDVEIAPSVRPSQSRRYKRGKHPLFWVGVTLLLMWLVWEATTVGLGWFVTTFVDPPQYGPTHGQMLQIVLGGGDSESHPSTLMAINTNGEIALIKMVTNNPSKNMTIVGPNLASLNFPDASKAEIALSSPSPLEVQVTVYSDQWILPFQRYSVQFSLQGDGKGGLKWVNSLTHKGGTQ
jgi:hypothetical protein